MVDRGKHLRNVAIVLLLAAAVWQLPGGGTAAATLGNLLSVILLGGLLFFGYRLYQQFNTTIMDLPDRQRTTLYVSVAVLMFAISATARLWDGGGLGVLLWFALLGAASFGVISVFRWYRESATY